VFKDNLILLRKRKGYSQEKVAEKMGISRQAYAKWENGLTMPTLDKASKLAELYEVSLDSLMKTVSYEGIGIIPPAPVNKKIWGSITMGERGQVVIPKDVRDQFGLKSGDRLVILTNEDGIAILPAEMFEARLAALMDQLNQKL